MGQMNNHRKTSNQILTLVFIDTGVDNYQQLFDGVVLEAQPFLIDTATDGIQQIGQILQQYPGPKTVEIISHGAPGCLYLGNTQLSLDTLKQYAPEVQLWDIDNLVLYGCHVASGDAGEEFVGKLSGLMGANISASQTLTGSATKGGNWELEINTGQQPPTSALQKEVMEAYSGVLNFLELKNEKIIITNGAFLSDVAATDVDGDGDVDFFIASDNEIALYLNDGSNNFTEQTISSSANGVSSVFAVDVDGDGDLDVLSASFDDKIALYLNDGSNNFTEQTISTNDGYVNSILAADVDDDGDVDVLSASDFYDDTSDSSYSKIALYETVSVLNNSAPTDLDIDNNTVEENVAPNSVVSTLSTTDPNSTDRFTYTLVTGPGDTDNKAFTIDGNQLKINNSPDYDTNSSYSIRVETTDVSGESYQEQLTINVNEAPTVIRGTPDNDRLIGNSDKDHLIGGKGNDFLLGKGGNDILEGRIGFDHLLAGSGDDTLYGGQGRDRLNGGPGDDIITGGASIDRFIFNTNRPYSQDDLGRDTIKDFDVERDIILLDRKTFTAIQEEDSFDDVFDTVTSDAAAATKDAVIVYNTNNGNLFYNENGSSAGLGSGGLFVTLENLPTLDADNFYFRG